MKNKEQILAYIAILLEKKQAIPIDVVLKDYRYIETGHIDSLAMMTFIFQIEDKFQIEINEDDILSDSFQSVGGLVDMIIGKLS